MGRPRPIFQHRRSPFSSWQVLMLGSLQKPERLSFKGESRADRQACSIESSGPGEISITGGCGTYFPSFPSTRPGVVESLRQKAGRTGLEEGRTRKLKNLSSKQRRKTHKGRSSSHHQFQGKESRQSRRKSLVVTSVTQAAFRIITPHRPSTRMNGIRKMLSSTNSQTLFSKEYD